MWLLTIVLISTYCGYFYLCNVWPAFLPTEVDLTENIWESFTADNVSWLRKVSMKRFSIGKKAEYKYKYWTVNASRQWAYICLTNVLQICFHFSHHNDQVIALKKPMMITTCDQGQHFQIFYFLPPPVPVCGIREKNSACPWNVNHRLHGPQDPFKSYDSDDWRDKTGSERGFWTTTGSERLVESKIRKMAHANKCQYFLVLQLLPKFGGVFARRREKVEMKRAELTGRLRPAWSC